ncbi:hypothetical protein KA017_01555 [Candidatus Woesebacteria bacterium]|nr:hypothetical protein [Candidatus Woesebacteria bacterium]
MSHQVVITVTDSQVVAEQINASAVDPVISRSAVVWKPGMLWEAIEAVLAQISQVKHIRILLTESLYHIGGFTIAKEKAGNRAYIQQKAMELLLEDLEVVRWDYVVSHTSGELAYIQVICVTKRFNEELALLQEKATVQVEAILPSVCALLDSFVEKDQSFVLVYSDDVMQVLSIIQDGLILFTTKFEVAKVAQKFTEVMAYAQKYLDFSVQKIVVSGLSKSAVLEESKGIAVIEAELSAASNFADLKQISGSDKKTLNIPLQAEDGYVINDFTDLLSVDSNEQNTSAKFWILLAVISGVGITVGYLLIRLFM